MKESSNKKIEQIIRRGYEFDLGDYISKGYNLFTIIPWLFIGFTLVVFVASMMGQIPVIGFLVNFLVTPAMVVGYAIVAHEVALGRQPEFSLFFKGFDHIGQLALLQIITIAAVIALCVPAVVVFLTTGGLALISNMDANDFILNTPVFPTAMVIAAIVTAISIVYLAVCWSWANYFIVFYNMEAWPAMEASRKIIHQQWLLIFVFFFIIGLILMAGVIGLCVGLLATYPIAMCASYAAFADVTRLYDAEDEDESIEDHMIL